MGSAISCDTSTAGRGYSTGSMHNMAIHQVQGQP